LLLTLGTLLSPISYLFWLRYFKVNLWQHFGNWFLPITNSIPDASFSVSLLYSQNPLKSTDIIAGSVGFEFMFRGSRYINNSSPNRFLSKSNSKSWKKRWRSVLESREQTSSSTQVSPPTVRQITLKLTKVSSLGNFKTYVQEL
jgi:hypothetical protein